jgi:hypothetical protein
MKSQRFITQMEKLRPREVQELRPYSCEVVEPGSAHVKSPEPTFVLFALLGGESWQVANTKSYGMYLIEGNVNYPVWSLHTVHMY